MSATVCAHALSSKPKHHYKAILFYELFGHNLKDLACKMVGKNIVIAYALG